MILIDHGTMLLTMEAKLALSGCCGGCDVFEKFGVEDLDLIDKE
ncbi:MAG: hypothetical protein ACM3WU_11765 [Bacillota bacterium]